MVLFVYYQCVVGDGLVCLIGVFWQVDVVGFGFDVEEVCCVVIGDYVLVVVVEQLVEFVEVVVVYVLFGVFYYQCLVIGIVYVQDCQCVFSIFWFVVQQGGDEVEWCGFVLCQCLGYLQVFG